jgi:hypothetical protein
LSTSVRGWSWWKLLTWLLGTRQIGRWLVRVTGYYITSRFAAINQLNIAPNLMHHAIELLIKFTLLKDMPQPRRSGLRRYN